MTFILSLSSIVILSAIFTNKFLNKLGIPALLFFLFMGMVFGSKINFADFNFTKELSSIALGFIIFYGGFCTKWNYDLFHLVFLISLLSVAIQGTLLAPIAKKLDMLDKHSDIRKTFNNYHEECAIKFLKATVPPDHEWIGKKIKDITFPQNSLVLIIKRNGKRILPKEITKIKEGDKITLTIPSDYFHED